MINPYKTRCPKCKKVKDNCLFSPSCLRAGKHCISCGKDYARGYMMQSPEAARHRWGNLPIRPPAQPGNGLVDVFLNKTTFLGSRTKRRSF